MREIAAAGLLLVVACGPPPTAKKEPSRPAEQPPPKILQFYVSPNVVAPKATALLCYGTENATALRLDPRIEEIKPSLARCIEVSPARDTTYALFARGEKGQEASAVTTVRVDPRATTPAHLLDFVSVSATTVKRGQPVQICYGAKGARKIVLKPFGIELPASSRGCVLQMLVRTTTLEVEAAGAVGATDRERITINVVD